MFCANCLTKNPDDAVRCVHCGAPLPVSPPGGATPANAPYESAPPSPPVAPWAPDGSAGSDASAGTPSSGYAAPSGGYPAFPRYPAYPDDAGAYPPTGYSAPAFSYPSAPSGDANAASASAPPDAPEAGGSAPSGAGGSSGLYGPYMPPQPYQPYPDVGVSGAYSQPVSVASDGLSGVYSQPAAGAMSGAYGQPAPYPPDGAWGPYSQPAPGASGTSGGYPSYPAAYPSVPLNSAYPAYPYAAPATRPLGPDETLSGGSPTGKRMGPLGGLRRALADRFPLPIAALALVIPLLIVGAVYAVVTLALGGDWAHGARVAGIAALALAGLALLITLLRVTLGRRVVASVALSLALIILLGALGGGGLLGAQPLRLAQAQQLEHAGQWASAIHEYTLAGQKPPASSDIARVYDEWGESDLSQRLYTDAATRFDMVIADYSGSGAYATRAERDLYRTYSGWITSGRADVNYPRALLFLDDYKNTASLCNASCLSGVNALETQAYYQYGVALATRGSYALAITQFEQAQTLTPGSHYALLAYQAAAPAYYSLGQQHLNSGDCSDALTAYQTLV
ncbi:MAG TPA: hypothetical protein VMV29_08405, partial [Ktedonobacterales bacterium]|nr:hypothetical protein [Ktedonobacterales bacterium]